MSRSLVRLVLDVPAALAVRAEEAAYATGVQGLEVVDEEVGAPRGRVIVRLYLPEGAEAERAAKSLSAALPEARLEVEAVAEAGRPRPRPRRLGTRFVVHAEALPTKRRGHRIPLVLDVTRAFGDGFHPTTRLVVGRLEKRYATKRYRHVLDVGTGTGVLALVAAELGATRVVATDVDPLARRAARLAVATHGHEDRISIRARMPRETFDLVLANLYRELLLRLARELAARVAPGGVLVVSGFAASSSGEIAACFESLGLAVHRRGAREGWGMLDLARPRVSSSKRSE